ncbi:MAG: hypothetical protein JNL97_09095 [Verrucomicrobiales bacterium]|nr:hypothetical protein [Verrucomicrobiales bacterium]
MLVFLIVVGSALALSAWVRGLGAPTWLVVGVPSLPTFGVFLYYVVRNDIDLGPHGGIVAAWKVWGVLWAAVVLLGYGAAVIVRGRRP